MYTIKVSSQGHLPVTGRAALLVCLLIILVVPACRDGNGLPDDGSLQLLSLSAGKDHSCGMASNDLGYCWGGNEAAQLGSETGPAAPSPEVVLVRPLKLQSIEAGGEITCGTITTRAVYCWGDGEAAPVRIAGSEDLTDLQIGDFACMLDAARSAWCWSSGQPTPVIVPGGLVFETLRVGYQGCGITAAHEVFCWDATGATATQLGGGILFDSISVGGGHACGLTSASVAYCWGVNGEGQLGDLSHTSSATPVAVLSALSFRVIMAGGSHSCAIATTDDTYCWGSGTGGQLGFGGQPFSVSVPGQVTGQLRFVKLAGGGTHTCGFDDSDAVYCWGSNQFGSVGDGSMRMQTAPTLVAGQ